MYSRKEFLLSAVEHCFSFAKEFHTLLSPSEDEANGKPNDAGLEPLFLEAMRLGIDPGTMSVKQLSQTVNLAKEKAENQRRFPEKFHKGGGGQLEKT